jgi:Rhodopirellula transposase DDE domain
MSTPDEIRAKYELLKPHLGRRARRLWAAAEASVLGRGGIKLVSAATGVSGSTISGGLRELEGKVPPRPDGYHRGGGAKLLEDKDPTLIPDLERLLVDETAGNPMNDERWVRKSSRKLCAQLRAMGHQLTYCTVCRLLRKLGYTLRPNQKWRGKDKAPGADEQFRYIAAQKAAFGESGRPVISIDTKKKELIGNFRNPGKVWCREPAEVNDHDFTSTAECRAVPFGIYDVGRNRGYFVVGRSNDTPAFAATAVARWWADEGRSAYPGATEALILADCGGTNGHRFRAWKLNLQERVSDRFGLTVTVCHYPPGCSKWNPIEHRLFSQVSMNWAGVPLRSLSLMLGYIRGTTTRTGLTVAAHLDEATYPKGQKVTPDEVARLRVEHHETCPDWNYTLRPRVAKAH